MTQTHKINGYKFYITRHNNQIDVEPADKKTNTWHWREIGSSKTVLDPSLTDADVIETINDAVEATSGDRGAPIEAPKPKADTPAGEKPPASKVLLSDEPLYQGHKGPGVGYLKSALPERRDGDSDTVTGERRPRKADKFKKSPVPLKGKYARIAAAAELKAKKKRRPAKRRKPKLKSSPHAGAPQIKIISR